MHSLSFLSTFSMFASALLFTATLANLAAAISEGDLSISLQVASTVASANDLIVTAIVFNPTSEDIRALAINNVLDNSPTQSFDIKAGDGSAVPFTGAKVCYVTWDLSSDAIYKNIPAGQSIAVNHTIGGIHDFSSFSAGTTFEVTPHAFSSILSSVEDASGIVPRADPVSFVVTDNTKTDQLFNSLPPQDQASLSTPVCSDKKKLQLIKDSLSSARPLAGGAATDIKSHPNGPEYKRYFGGNKQSDIWYNFDRIAGDLASAGKRNIFCASDFADSASACKNNPYIAYTVIYPDGRTPIYTCDILAKCGTPSSVCSTKSYDLTTSSRGGVILHELAHAVTGAADIAYGCPATEKLSAADKKKNADNYRCMGLNIFLDYNCH
ncbi:hypothetical protein CYLTODRAFT_383861 [Cylindrobasidium torrendii FP15055 ss-10]|uniref:deuterolysin n=1 Tax=Cylindrobasidium torrendii FP15055 ss-10 TaxID=1314674 RepID=A0A0D7AVM0_9AGAR|nr:hypothetical protein CYLTODRAFT_383861 [Cylindrobasidium torrendii FP15055 ss-10]